MKIYNPTGKKLNAQRDMRGSNQYQRVVRVRRPRLRAFSAVTVGSVIFAYALTTMWLIPFYNDVKFQPAFAPTVDKAYALVVPTVTPTPSENDEIRAYIKEVFGTDSDKAFKLLQCENASLKPDRVNTAGNFPEGSRDIGVFQINEYWQKVPAKFLFNWKINVQIAHQLYTENGFKQWACAKRMGV